MSQNITYIENLFSCTRWRNTSIAMHIFSVTHFALSEMHKLNILHVDKKILWPRNRNEIESLLRVSECFINRLKHLGVIDTSKPYSKRKNVLPWNRNEMECFAFCDLRSDGKYNSQTSSATGWYFILFYFIFFFFLVISKQLISKNCKLNHKNRLPFTR